LFAILTSNTGFYSTLVFCSARIVFVPISTNPYLFSACFKLFSLWVIFREEFDEEKEPDEMVLSGWIQPVSAAENKDKSVGNGGSTSDAAVTAVESEKDDEITIVSTLKKRKLPDETDISSATTADADTKHQKQLEVIDDEDDLVMLDGDLDSFKKRRLS